MNGPIFLLMFFFLPETSASNILLRRAQRLRRLTGNKMLKSQSEIDQGNATFAQIAKFQLIKPTEIMLKDPAVFFVNAYTSFCYGIYYSFFEAFPLVYILTEGGPGSVTEVTNFYAFLQAFNFSYLGYSSAVTCVLVAVTLVAGWCIHRLAPQEAAGA